MKKFWKSKFVSSLIFIQLLLLITAMFVFFGCSCNKNNENNTNGLQLTDLSNRTIILNKPAAKIAALSASDCEVLYAIGAGDKIIARGTYCDYPEEVQNIKDVGSGELTNLEELIALKPDVVLMSKTGFTLDQVSAIENAGIKTLVNQPDSFDQIYSYIQLLGKLTKHEDNAANLIDKMKSTINEYKTKSKNKNKENKTIYFETSPLQYGLWTAGKDTFLDEIAQILNVENLFKDINGWQQVSSEQIIKRNPDFIVSLTTNNFNNKNIENEISSREQWQNIKAIKNNKIYCIDNSMITRPGPRLINAIKDLYGFIYDEK